MTQQKLDISDTNPESGVHTTSWCSESSTEPASSDSTSVVPLRREEEIRGFIVKELLPEGYEDIDIDTPLLDWGIIDSILIQSLLRFMEDSYGLMLPPEEILPEDFATIRALAAMVERSGLSPGTDRTTIHLETLYRVLERYGMTRQWVTSPTGRHHVLRCPGRKPTLVLISGLGTSAGSWGQMMRSLHNKREVLAPDLAGFGVSDPPIDGDYSFRNHVRTTLEVLDRLVDEPCVLVGNSAGGMIAVEIARQRPERVKALVVISFGRIRTGGSWWLGLKELSVNLDEFWRRAFFDPRPLDRAVREHMGVMLASRAYREFLDSRTAAQMDTAFEGLRVPTLFIGGMDDRIITRQVMEDGAQAVPGSRLEWIPRCGHCPPVERPEELLVYIEHFLKGLNSNGAHPPHARK